MKMNTQEQAIVKKLLEVSSRIVGLLPAIITTIDYLKTHIAVTGNKPEVEARKQRLIVNITTIRSVTEAGFRQILAAKQAGHLEMNQWKGILGLVQGEIDKLHTLEKKIELYVHTPSSKLTAEIDTLVSEIKRLYEEELVQLRNMSTG